MLKYQIIVLSCAFCLLADTLCAQTMEFYSISAVAGGANNSGIYAPQGTSNGSGISNTSRSILFTELSRPVDRVEELTFDGGSMSLILRSSSSETATDGQAIFRKPPTTNGENPTNPKLDLTIDDANLFLCLLLLLMVIVKRWKRKADTHLSTKLQNKPV
ncbi:MAG: hypothetical protein SOT07_04510 [Paludibacteraceae bacterium]|nr:hypothetical protein [Paludibacteraceae bacterium]